LAPSLILSQETSIEWSENYTLSETDFRAVPPATGEEQSIYLYVGLSYKAMNYQLLFANLNPLVSNAFSPSASWIDEGSETSVLLNYAQTSWNMYELAARKLRKKMFDNRSRLSTKNIEIFLHQINQENTKMLSTYSKESKFARDSVMQEKWEIKMDSLLGVYSEYCKTCKKPKKRKKKK
jgi:hypothetical protein